MAEVTVADHGTIQKGFGNEVFVRRFVYNVAVDGGASADTYTLGTFGDDMVILQAYTNITTAFTSGGSATLKIGVGADDDAILAATAVASLTAGVKAGAAASEGLLAAAGDKIVVTIGTADMTAGKLEVVVVCVSR